VEGQIPALTGHAQRWRSVLPLLGALLAALLLFRATVADWNRIPSGSMLPSVLIGDRILVDKLAYHLRVPFTAWRMAQWRAPARGEVVTFESPEDGRLMVKRVVGIPGDLVALTDNRLAINGTTAYYQPLAAAGNLPERVGEPVREGCAAAGYGCFRERLLGSERVVRLHRDRDRAASRDFPPVRVPEGHYLVLGDNRDQSHDSRAIGFVPRERIVGRAIAVAFSLDHANHFLPRTERFFVDLR
jgi:signal peptidase I